jgi:hypothetical protein
VELNAKLSHHTPWRRLRERRYSSHSFSTSALDGGEWSASRHGRALASGKGPPVPIVQEAGWAPEPVWTQRLEEKSFRLYRGSNFDRPVVQPVARHYTDLSYPALHGNSTSKYSHSLFKYQAEQVLTILKYVSTLFETQCSCGMGLIIYDSVLIVTQMNCRLNI